MALDEWIAFENEKVVSQLNRSYNLHHEALPKSAWIAKPSIFLKIVYRLFLIVFKRLASPFLKEQNTMAGEAPTTAQPKKTSILEVVLSRQIKHPYSEPEAIRISVLKENHTSPTGITTSDAPIATLLLLDDADFADLQECWRYILHFTKVAVKAIALLRGNRSEEEQKQLQGIGIQVLYNSRLGEGASIDFLSPYVVLLSSQALVQEQWLEPLLETLKTTKEAAAVGSMVLSATGMLLEAGIIRESSGATIPLGRDDNPNKSIYRYLRPVEGCSHCIAVPSPTFAQILQEPSFQTDKAIVSCCQLLGHRGGKIYYQPFSRIVLNKSQGEEPAGNRSLKNLYRTIGRYSGKRTLLVMDHYMPRYDRESGSNRLMHLLRIWKKLGYHVLFWPEDQNPEQPYAQELEKMGIEVMARNEGDTKDFTDKLGERLHAIDIAWICRPDLNFKYAEWFKTKGIRVCYDTVDLHFIRLSRRHALHPNVTLYKKQADYYQEMEIGLASMADATIAITEDDRRCLETFRIHPIEVVPNIHIKKTGTIPSFSEREGILFIGSYDHNPNVDAALWLCKEIMPLVWANYPLMKVTLLGNNPTQEILGLQTELISVPGYQPSLDSYFQQHRLFVAPLRFGAGMKGKIGTSLEYSLPIVCTTVAAEGMGLLESHAALVKDEKEALATSILQLYNDEELWTNLSRNSDKALAPYSPETISSTIDDLFDHLLKEQLQGAQ